MRTFEEQRKEFIDLALKLIENEIFRDSTSLHLEKNCVVISDWYYEWKFKIKRYEENQNETEIQKLHNLLEEVE